uniref:Thioredoxin domain-containing protein n=1 Tax=viral metagenome TaxID=1070528 RepID=A0A6C0JF24_9ZZZZ
MTKTAGATPISKSSNSYYSRIMSTGAKMSTTTIIVIIAVVLFIILAIYYYYNHVSPKLKTSYHANREGEFGSSESGPTKQAELMLFYADWCPHCKTAKPIWNDLKTQYQNKTINGYQVIFTDVNCSTESAETEQMMNKYNIEGFPTIKLLKDGQIIEYDAKPTKETLNEFLNTVL